MREGGRVRGPAEVELLADSQNMENQGYRSTHNPEVQINSQNRGTDQGNQGKPGVQINFSGGQNQGTDQFFWKAKPGYR